ncbi:hotdog domain-containing protein [Acidovorax sp. A1169]|uniref:hotdog domain-containing protein n=1 Tax=Acidovorax sp. A1169 TaxID=3059524 RepID=UPI003521144A
MQQHVGEAEVVVGRTIRIDHCEPIPPGVQLRRRLQSVGDRSATFFVRAYDAHETVCDAVATLVNVARVQLRSRLSAKLNPCKAPERSRCSGEARSHHGWQSRVAPFSSMSLKT